MYKILIQKFGTGSKFASSPYFGCGLKLFLQSQMTALSCNSAGGALRIPVRGGMVDIFGTNYFIFTAKIRKKQQNICQKGTDIKIKNLRESLGSKSGFFLLKPNARSEDNFNWFLPMSH